MIIYAGTALTQKHVYAGYAVKLVGWTVLGYQVWRSNGGK